MTIKFTKTGFGNEKNNEALLFEFLDHELSDKIELKSKTLKNSNEFVGSLQTSQITGTLIEPISFNGKFFGDYVDNQNRIIRAKERFDQLQNLNGRPVKFWIDGFKVIVIISNLKLIAEDYDSCSYEIALQPHDFIEPPIPTLVEPVYDMAVNLYNRLTDSSKTNLPVIDETKVSGEFERLNDPDDLGKSNPNNETPEEKKLKAQARLKKALNDQTIFNNKRKQEGNPLFKFGLTDQQVDNNLKEGISIAQKEFMKFIGGGK
jgi:hypothetical protein